MEPEIRQEVPPEEWGPFLTAFGRQHLGWLVTLEEAPAGCPATWSAGHRVSGLEVPEEGAVRLRLADERGGELGHTLKLASVALLRTPDGADSGLELRDAAGGTLRLHFRVPARPEALDGLAEEEALDDLEESDVSHSDPIRR